MFGCYNLPTSRDTRKVKDATLIDYSTPVRPTRNRLMIAMGIAACSIALLLASLGPMFDLAGSDSKPGLENNEPMAVTIRNSERPDNEEIHPLPQEQFAATKMAEGYQDAAPVVSLKPPDNSEPVRDWHAILDEVAVASVDERIRQQESRELMWRRSYSVMFKPANDMVLNEEAPLLSEIRFKYHSRVVGLGINIGPCFIGIPVVGVPVEQRSGAITVFVCG
jgi:hypothetical protein